MTGCMQERVADAVKSDASESSGRGAIFCEQEARYAREGVDSMPTWSEEGCRDADARRRFMAVHFPSWVIDLEVALLRRALSRSDRVGECAAAVDACTSLKTLAFVSGIDVPLVVVRERHRVQQVIATCPLAYAAGVRVGMTMAQAEAMCVGAPYVGAPYVGAPCVGTPYVGTPCVGASCACRMAAPAGPVDEAIARRARRWHQLRALVGQPHAASGTGPGAPAPRALGGIPWRERIVSLTGDMMAVSWNGVVARKAIERLAQCLQRWIPVVAIDTTGSGDTLVGDLTGCATLYRSRSRPLHGAR